MPLIRVFPKKSKWIPDDNLCFVGDPPLFMPENQPVHISCVFTWHIEECERLKRSWGRYYDDVQVNGPAYGHWGVEFVPGKYIKQGATITSRGCTKDCKWCLVPEREGWIRELPIVPGNDVLDNNLLACSRGHIESVFNMLKGQKAVKFSGGLDAEMLQPWHVDLLKTISLKFAWFACDYPGAMKNIERVADLMSDFSIEKKRCYVLVGMNGETVTQAEKRLRKVLHLGFKPFSMLYRPGNEITYKKPKEWQDFTRKWTRPACYMAAERVENAPI